MNDITDYNIKQNKEIKKLQAEIEKLKQTMVENQSVIDRLEEIQRSMKEVLKNPKPVFI